MEKFSLSKAMLERLDEAKGEMCIKEFIQKALSFAAYNPNEVKGVDIIQFDNKSRKPKMISSKDIKDVITQIESEGLFPSHTLIAERVGTSRSNITYRMKSLDK